MTARADFPLPNISYVWHRMCDEVDLLREHVRLAEEDADRLADFIEQHVPTTDAVWAVLAKHDLAARERGSARTTPAADEALKRLVAVADKIAAKAYSQVEEKPLCGECGGTLESRCADCGTRHGVKPC